jgi:hypothetical protein
MSLTAAAGRATQGDTLALNRKRALMLYAGQAKLCLDSAR